MKRIIWSTDAWNEYLAWCTRDKRITKRILELIKDIRRDPYSGEGIGNPELLRGDLAGWASRRISDEHRLVYRVRGDDLEIASYRFHY